MSIATRRIAFRFLKGASRSRVPVLSLTTWLSLAGITLGVAATCLVTGVFNGFISTLSGVVVDKMGHFLLLHRSGGVESLERARVTLSPLFPHGTFLEPVGWVEGMASGKSAGQGVSIEGLSGEGWSRVKKFLAGAETASSTSAPEGGPSPGQIWLGDALSRKLGISAGESLRLIVAQKRPNGGRQLYARVFRVEHLVSVGMHDYDGKAVLMHLEELRTWLNWSDEASFLRARLPQGTTSDVETEQRLAHELAPPWHFKSWKQLHRNFFASIVIEKTFLAIAVGVIIFISMFNVMSTLYLLLSEKMRDLSILRALGGSRRFLRQTFLWCGLLYGVGGATCGVVLALLLAWVVQTVPIIELPRDVYHLSRLPVEIRWLEWAGLWAATAFLALVAAWAPARRAARLLPVEGLRNE